jgi:hypothetical protein
MTTNAEQKEFLRYQATLEIAKHNEVFGPSKRPNLPAVKNAVAELAGELVSGLDKTHPAWKSPYFSGADKNESSNPVNNQKVPANAVAELQHRLSQKLTNAPTPGLSAAPTLTRK